MLSGASALILYSNLVLLHLVRIFILDLFNSPSNIIQYCDIKGFSKSFEYIHRDLRSSIYTFYCPPVLSCLVFIVYILFRIYINTYLQYLNARFRYEGRMIPILSNSKWIPLKPTPDCKRGTAFLFRIVRLPNEALCLRQSG